MKHLGLFEGIGGFSLAARWIGWETVAWVEINEFCQKVLKKNFPEAQGYGDIKEFDGRPYRGTINIITGGFPCQDLSVANPKGKKGFEGSKSGLYTELIRVIREVRPEHALIENVYGLVTQDNGKALERMLGDLAIDGYSSIPLVIYSSAVGANHHRKRLFTYATRLGDGVQTYKIQAGRNISIDLPGWSTEPEICRVYDGTTRGLDKRRLAALGNAIVPQVAYEIFKAIESIHEQS